MQTPIEKVLEKFPNAKRDGKGWKACCPAHDDTNPSLHISEGNDGKALVKCFAGCETKAVCQAIGLTLADLMPNATTASRPAKPEKNPQVYATSEKAIAGLEKHLGTKTKSWDYHDAKGQPVGVVVRWDTENGKEIRPVSLIEGGWQVKAMPAPRPLYRLPDLKLAERVYVCEGEKAADAALTLGLHATTSAGGSGAAHQSDWQPLAGKEVIILPDNDEVGEKYASDVAGHLSALNPPCMCKIVRLPGLLEAGDIVDWLDAKGCAAEPESLREELEALLLPESTTTTKPIHATPIEKQRAGIELKLIPASQLGDGEQMNWIWHGWLAKGHSTLLVGLWKAGKSTLIGHLLKGFSEGGDIAGTIKPAKVILIAEESQSLWARRRQELGFCDNVHFSIKPFKGRPSAKDWLNYIELVAEVVKQQSFDVVMIDTWQSVNPSSEENEACRTMEALAPLHLLTEAGAAVMLIHHSKKGDANEGQVCRGSGALPGFVDILVELRRYNAEDRENSKRTLKSYSRFDETPSEVVLELREDGYYAIGTKADACLEERLRAIEQLIGKRTDMSSEEMLEQWDSPYPKPGKRTLEQDLRLGTECIPARWKRSGKGRRGSPYRYSFDSRTVEALIRE